MLIIVRADRTGPSAVEMKIGAVSVVTDRCLTQISRLMMVLLPQNVKCITINTGNILSLNDITKKPGQNPTEELSEAIAITLKERDCTESLSHNGVIDSMLINRRNDDLVEKLTLYERSDLKIGIKLFINSDNEYYLSEAVTQVFSTLKINSIDNIVLAFHSQDKSEEKLLQLKKLWHGLETAFNGDGKMFQFGLSDIDEANFRAIYDWAKVKPSIIQINLATCCVVPPTLQQFCKENEVQLLTHSDPSEILPQSCLPTIFGERDLTVNWVSRFQVHVKCRGVLATKGYLVSLSRQVK